MNIFGKMSHLHFMAFIPRTYIMWLRNVLTLIPNVPLASNLTLVRTQPGMVPGGSLKLHIVFSSQYSSLLKSKGGIHDCASHYFRSALKPPFLDPVMPEFISTLPAGFLRFPVGCVGRTPQGRTQERLDPGLLALYFSCALPAPYPSNFPSLEVAAVSSLWLCLVP